MTLAIASFTHNPISATAFPENPFPAASASTCLRTEARLAGSEVTFNSIRRKPAAVGGFEEDGKRGVTRVITVLHLAAAIRRRTLFLLRRRELRISRRRILLQPPLPLHDRFAPHLAVLV